VSRRVCLLMTTIFGSTDITPDQHSFPIPTLDA
jgi:hypothetical protein